MEKNVGNPDHRHYQKLTNEEVGFAASKHDNNVNEAELSRDKIGKYAIEKKNNVYEKGGSKRSLKEVKMVVDNHEAITQLKEFIMSDEINGSDMKLVIHKTLYASDLKRNQNRLNMPFKQVETHDFLTPKEKQVLGDGFEIEVQIVGPNLQMHKKQLSLKIWSMVRTKNYVLKTNWCDFVEANKNVLKEKTTIQVWSFRKDGKLCFAVVCVDKPVENPALPEDVSSAGSSLIRYDLELLEV